MIKRKFRYFSLFLFALMSLALPSSDAFARGGGGRGGGGGGRGGRGAGGRGGSAAGAAARGIAGSAGRSGRNGKVDEQEKVARREERMGRVAVARLVYAKREREREWDSETEDRFARLLKRILGGTSE